MVKLKADTYVITEILDERGRYISSNEFKWIMNYFKDRYDPRRLSFALGYVTGLRIEDYVNARITWFDPDFKTMKMSQCKAHVRKKDGIVKAKTKPKFVPLPSWLSEDLSNYVKFRILMAHYTRNELQDLRLFPSLRKVHLRSLFRKLRIKYGHKEKWLLDLWQITKHYKNGKLVKEQKWFRVACHAPRANYVTIAYEIANKDLVLTKMLSGHDETKDVERYIRINGLQEKKLLIKERMDMLTPTQQTPLLKGQKQLTSFIF